MKSKDRSGSALIIVLGMLSVLMLMSVAFSTFMRTERGATTNLKNSHVAELSMQTALAMAIQSIEDSLSELKDGYSNAVVDSPVAVWAQPWLASCGPESLLNNSQTDPFFISKRRVGTDAKPEVLSAAAAEFLSSNQIAMIKAADVGWAPIYSGIGVSNVYSESESRYGRNAGYPVEDSIVGRYAFVALDTTGYLDIGKIGAMDEAARKASSGGEARLFIPPGGTVKAADGEVIPSPFSSQNGPSALSRAASAVGAFTSYRDVKVANNSAGLNMRFPTSRDMRNTTYMPPDLYSGCTVSLDELNPEGEPKLHIPSRAEYNDSSFRSANLLAFEQRAFPAMMSVFARSRKTGNLSSWSDAPGKITLYGLRSSTKVEIPRSALATVALLDAVDPDNISGKSVKTGLSYWKRLQDLGTVETFVDGESVSDGITGNGASSACNDPLNMPCTESAPLLNMLYAYVTIDTANAVQDFDKSRMRYSVPNSLGVAEPRDSGWYKEYTATLHVGAKALCLNRNRAKNERRNLKMKVEFDVLGEYPGSRSPNVSAGETGIVGDEIDQLLNFFTSDGGAKIAWDQDGEFFAGGKSFTIQPSDSIDDSSMTPDGREISTGFYDDGGKTWSFKIRCGAKKVGKPGIYGESGDPTEPPTGLEFYPLTKIQDEIDEGRTPSAYDIWIPLRFKVAIEDGNDTIEQIPAPILDGADANRAWWVRLDVGVYHAADQNGNHTHGDSSWSPPSGMKLKGSEGDLAAGWAVCLAPQFGMDTTSLATYSDNEPEWNQIQHKFWINNVTAHAGAAGNGSNWDGVSDIFSRKFIKDMDIADPNAESGLWAAFDGNGAIAPTILTSWLFATEGGNNSDDIWFKWFAGSDSTTDRSCADFMHTLSSDDDEWILTWDGMTQRAGRLQTEMCTWIPSDGIKTIADLGALTIGPFETLSLFKTWRPSMGVSKYNPESDFHPVMDYFTVSSDRYPTSSEIADKTSQGSGEVRWDEIVPSGSISDKNTPLFSAVHSGRVNLNLPRLLERSPDAKASKYPRVDGSNYYNPYPLAAALNGTPYVSIVAQGTTGSIKTNSLPESAALKMAAAHAYALYWAGKYPHDSDYKSMTVVNHSTNLVLNAGGSRVRRPVVRDLSFFSGAYAASSNAVLQAYLDALEAQDKRYGCDYMRESVLQGVSEAFTTRGQSFLVALRADAYTSRFGMSDDPSDGQTLASTHAIVELFRDPEPARLPDGTFPKDDDNNPVLYHNWFIRSFRLL